MNRKNLVTKTKGIMKSLKTILRFTNDDGSAGGLVGFIMLIGIIGLMLAILSPIPDTLTKGMNSMIGAGMPVSQDRMDTQANLSTAFMLCGFVLVLACGFNLWINSMREQDGAV